MTNAQEWLDKNYPKESRNKIREVRLNEPSLEGELDLGDFAHRQGLKIKIFISPYIDKTKLIIKNKPKKSKIIMQNPLGSVWTRWKEHGLTYQEAQQWILIGFRLKDYKEVKQWKNSNFAFQEVKDLINIGLEKQDIEFALYLRWKRYQFNQISNLESLKEEFGCWLKKIKSASEYLDTVYPKEQRKVIKYINVSYKSLTGNLDLNDFVNLERLDCSFNRLITLNLGNCLKLKRIDCNTNQLIELKVNNLTVLDWLECSSNLLTTLDIGNCNQLKELRCSNNYLENLKLPFRVEQLICLNLTSNNLPKQDLSVFSPLINLKDLHLGNWDKEKINRDIYNRFIGSLENLKNLTKLEYLDISNTDINSGVEYLPDNWSFKSEKKERVFYSVFERPESKLKEIVKQLTNLLEYGLCKKCQKVINRYNKCQHCNTKANQNIDYFIQKYKELRLIPYEQFTNIEYLAEGGFGKVYRAKWNVENKIVVLKSLNDSWDISENFLREVANHQALFNCDTVVKCHGISQDLQTNNCLMVIDYIKDGDLKKFLQNNQLNFEDKFKSLSHIALGLNEIHNRKLIHRDFHSGNILSEKVGVSKKPNKCYIADLGLCRPANDDGEDKIYGVLPYVAPEVLRGESHTQTSDIYSFGVVAYEMFASRIPYQEHAHDEFLAVKICQGLRPNIVEITIPQSLKDLIAKCWDANPLNRPKAKELRKIIGNWKNEAKGKSEFAKQYQEVVKADKEKLCQVLSKTYKEYKGEIKEVKFEEIKEVKLELFKEFFKKDEYRKLHRQKKAKKANKELDKLLAKDNNLVYQTHPQAIYTSHLLNFKNLPQPQNSKELNEVFYKTVESLEHLRISDPVKFSEELKEKINSLESQEILTAESEEFAPIKTLEQPVISTDWTNINPNFTKDLINQWKELDFSYQQTNDWLNIGLQPSDHYFAAFLRDQKHLTPEEVLNQGNYQQLSKEFFTYWQEQQAQVEITPK